MIVWYVAGTVTIVWLVFQSPGIDFRMVAAGSLAPLVVDAPMGRMAIAHALLTPVVVLTITMLATMGRGRRLLRRRIIGLPIGWLCGLALSGAFGHTAVFWWPTAGARGTVSLLPSWPWIAAREALGLVAAWWCWFAFGLEQRERRQRFLGTGRLVPDGAAAERIDE